MEPPAIIAPTVLQPREVVTVQIYTRRTGSAKHRTASGRGCRYVGNIMTRPEPLPNEVPIDDAVEQSRPLVGNDEQERLRDEGSPPLEADAPDWQEQHQLIEDAGEDDFR